VLVAVPSVAEAEAEAVLDGGAVLAVAIAVEVPAVGVALSEESLEQDAKATHPPRSSAPATRVMGLNFRTLRRESALDWLSE
jgi:hypothetical protein